jgi:mannose-6-phosphate isomerase-like protein (cupin superfamily)
MSEPFFVTPEVAPSALNVVGEDVTVLARGERTGSYEVFLQSGGEGVGPPLHSHPWDEAYFRDRGRAARDDRHKVHDLAAGGFAHIPAGSYHNYAGVGGPARFVSITSQSGAARFFADLDREVPTVPPDLPALLAVAERHRVQVQPPA